ncbi:MAG TPA: NAD(P)-binding protein [Terriglobales bacterium]|nr:NAD(P)-binding protein [Terriglobales bacterium]
MVIGSGFGGSVSALRLVDKGYKVAVIEMGRRSFELKFHFCVPHLDLLCHSRDAKARL